eukprot:11157867-Prorocentrum_lima.AAC.1
MGHQVVVSRVLSLTKEVGLIVHCTRCGAYTQQQARALAGSCWGQGASQNLKAQRKRLQAG